MMGATAKRSSSDEDVLQTLARNTYQETADLHGLSRGKVYTIALDQE